MRKMHSFVTRNYHNVEIDLDKIIAADFQHNKIVIEGGHEFEVRLGHYEYGLITEHNENKEKEADVEPVRHGEWEKNTHAIYRLYEMANGEHYYEKVAEIYRCSECGGTSDFRTNYCQHCGAKMDKG